MKVCFTKSLKFTIVFMTWNYMLVHIYGHLGKVLCFGGCGQGAERGGMIRDMNVQREESDKNSSPDTTELQDSV